MHRAGIRTRLFLSYTFIATLVIATLSLFFYTRMSSVVRERALESSRQQLQRIDSALSQSIRDLDRISAQVIYNPDFQNKFEETFDSAETYEVLEQKNAFVRILATLNGPSFIAQQINVFNLDGHFISFGLKIDPYKNLKERVALLDWVEPTRLREGDKMINPPHRDELFRSGGLVYSLSRLFPHGGSSTDMFVEVQQSYDKLEDIAGESRLPSSNRLYIFDDDGRLFYPVPEAEDAKPSFAWSDIPELPSGEFHSVTETAGGERTVIGWLRSSFSGLTVVAAQPERELLSPVASLRNVVVTVTVAAEGVALLLAYWVASSITRPIRLIQRDVRRFDLEQIGFNTSARHQKTYRKASYEIQELYDGFLSMKTRLNLSVEQMLNAQKRENLAHMRALSNQLQPHFVFNTLSSIGVLAENAGADQAAAMAYRMMHMMSYMSGVGAEPVPLSEELVFTESYLQLMKLRYQDKFDYIVQIDESLQQTMIPKFVLQPIAENSFAHGFKRIYPPWLIRIEGSAEADGSWRLSIADNGSGFEEEALSRLTAFIEELSDSSSGQLDRVESKGIGGLGLQNTVMRLHLFYGGRASFAVRNEEEGMTLTVMVAPRGDEHV